MPSQGSLVVGDQPSQVVSCVGWGSIWVKCASMSFTVNKTPSSHDFQSNAITWLSGVDDLLVSNATLTKSQQEQQAHSLINGASIVHTLVCHCCSGLLMSTNFHLFNQDVVETSETRVINHCLRFLAIAHLFFCRSQQHINPTLDPSLMRDSV